MGLDETGLFRQAACCLRLPAATTITAAGVPLLLLLLLLLSGEPAAAARVDSSLLEAEVADLRAEMQQAVADKKQIEQQYLEQVIAVSEALGMWGCRS